MERLSANYKLSKRCLQPSAFKKIEMLFTSCMEDIPSAITIVSFRMNPLPETVFSIYIPRMRAIWTKEAIQHMMKIQMIGTVSCIDFTTTRQKPGFQSEDIRQQPFKSAFVHFTSFQSNYLQKILELNKSYKFTVSPTEYWIFLKNKNPVRRTWMNIHQIVENGRHVEAQQAELKQAMQEQREELLTLREEVSRLQKAISILETKLHTLRHDPMGFYTSKR